MTKKTAPSNQSDSFEKIPVQIFSDSKAGSAFVARQIADFIREKQKKKEKCVLGLATGSTPKSLYAELVRLHREEKLSFKNVITFNLDEYFPIDNHDTILVMEEMIIHKWNNLTSVKIINFQYL